MNALMCCKIALVSEGPITHITRIRAVPIMNALMYYKTALVSEGLITPITNIRAFVCVDVLADGSCN